MNRAAVPSPLKSKGVVLFFKLALVILVVYLSLKQFSFSQSDPLKVLSPSLFSHETSRDQEIPKKIWQTWHTPSALLANEEKERVRTWQEKNPSYQYELLTDHGAENFVRYHFSNEPLLQDVFLNLTDTILRADFLRYLVLLAQGGLYADVDVECREPVDTWIPPALQGKAGIFVGIESDRMPVENDKKLYQDHREYIWGITNWTFMAKRGHPFIRLVAETVARNLLELASKQNRSISAMELSYKEVIGATGPRAFTEAFFAYSSRVAGKQITYADATMLEEPKLIGDVLLLPIRAFSTAEADRTSGGGARSSAWPAVIYHWSVGSWKKTHFQKPEEQAEP
ncbi:hypothetical protein MMC28_009266 [Mycoblastus sanguinarius]|nr:hypothetical protein [Mycoblastus sanguinarius]